MRSKQIWGLVAAFSLVALGQAEATIITSASGLALPESVTFEEIVLGPGAAVTSEYAGLGLTFSPGTVYDANGSALFPGFSDHHVGNFSPVVDPWSLFFGTSQTQASFALATNPNTTLITVLLGGVIVDSGSFATTFNDPLTAFVQVTGVSFDEIRLSVSGDQLLVIDTVAFENPVPEPGSLALVGLGLIATTILARRRRAAGTTD